MTKSHKVDLTAVIIARNEENKIADAVESVSWADEVIVVDSGSVDKTPDIAKMLGAAVIKTSGKNYSDWRNDGLKNAQGRWILYIDADERVTPLLRKEILETLGKELSQSTAFAIPRRNFIFGKEMKYGGLWPDYQKRLFRKENISGWSGELHEEPEIKGPIGHLKEPLIHLKHDNIEDMVVKTNRWSETEAKLLYRGGHPKMSWWRFLRIMTTEFYLRFLTQRGFLDGTEGVIYSLYQVWSKFVTYSKLWEMQAVKHSL